MNRGRGQSTWRRYNAAAAVRAQPSKPATQARGAIRDRGMNRLETAYAVVLESRRVAGEIKWWKYEAVKLRLADNTFYTPDFMVMGIGGEIEIHETKGFWREDARVKIKVAAEIFPFRFRGVTRARGGGWQTESF